jgi:hypothetical protein
MINQRTSYKILTVILLTKQISFLFAILHLFVLNFFFLCKNSQSVIFAVYFITDYPIHVNCSSGDYKALQRTESAG